jgi:hypothetical protein
LFQSLFRRLKQDTSNIIERRMNGSLSEEIMEERRSGQRRQGPIRKGDRRKQLDEGKADEGKANVQRGSERRQTDRRTGVERRHQSSTDRLSAQAA